MVNTAKNVFITPKNLRQIKTPEETGDLNGNEIANKTTAVPNNSQQNNSETVTNQNYKIRYKIMFGIIEKCLWDY